MAHLELVRVDCGPSYCPVEARLELAMEYTIDRPLRDASWEIKVRTLRSIGVTEVPVSERPGVFWL